MWEHSGKALMWRYGTPIAAAVSSEDDTCLSEAGYWSGLTKRTCLLRGHSPLTVSLERSKIHFTWTPGYLTSVLGRTITPLEATRGVRQMSVSDLLVQLLDASGVSVQKAIVVPNMFACLVAQGIKWLQHSRHWPLGALPFNGTDCLKDRS